MSQEDNGEFFVKINDSKKSKKTQDEAEFDGGNGDEHGSDSSDFELNGDTAPAYVEKKQKEIVCDLFIGLFVFILFCGVTFIIIKAANPYTEGSTDINPALTSIPVADATATVSS